MGPTFRKPGYDSMAAVPESDTVKLSPIPKAWILDVDTVYFYLATDRKELDG